ncbi:hypothetical protein LTR94_033670, partial [Friedmanniomyces endolithicus]
QLPGGHRAARRRARRSLSRAGVEPRICRRPAETRGDPPAGRTDQHLRHPGILPARHAPGAGAHRRDRLRQSVPAVRHLSHAAHGGRAGGDDQGQPRPDPPHPAGRQSGPLRAGHGRDQLPLPARHARRDR